MNSDRIIAIRTFDTLIQALVATDTLQQNGIAAMTDDSNCVKLYPMFGSASSGIRLCVFEKDAEYAEEILKEL